MSELAPDLVAYQAKDSGQALDAAAAAVRSYCGWHITPSVTETVEVWSPDGRSLFLQTLALTAVASVVQDGTTLDSSECTFDSYGHIKRTSGSRFSTSTRVTVEFTHGYADWPDDAKDVVLAMAQRSISDTRGIVARPGQTAGVFTETFGPLFTEADQVKLAPHVISAGFA